LQANHFQQFLRSIGTCSLAGRELLNTGEYTK